MQECGQAFLPNYLYIQHVPNQEREGWVKIRERDFNLMRLIFCSKMT